MAMSVPALSVCSGTDRWLRLQGLAVGPMPFKCDVRCRSPARAELVKELLRTEAAEILIPFERNLASEDKEWLESVRDHDD